MTDVEEREEWLYRYNERLGILCGDGEPTEEQKQIAAQEADEWMFNAAVVEE